MPRPVPEHMSIRSVCIQTIRVENILFAYRQRQPPQLPYSNPQSDGDTVGARTRPQRVPSPMRATEGSAELTAKGTMCSIEPAGAADQPDSAPRPISGRGPAAAEGPVLPARFPGRLSEGAGAGHE